MYQFPVQANCTDPCLRNTNPEPTCLTRLCESLDSTVVPHNELNLTGKYMKKIFDGNKTMKINLRQIANISAFARVNVRPDRK